MGLMSLLARKINPDKHQPQLRAPTYDRKISSKSPVRFVQTVSPNGPISHNHDSSGVVKPPSNGLRSPQYPSSPLSQTSFSADCAAPAPVVLGFRGDEAPSRPGTAHSKLDTDARRIANGGRPGSSAVQQKSALRLSQLTSRSRSSLVPAPAPTSTPTTPAPAVLTKQKGHRPQTSISSSKLARSVRSDGGKGHVDLLDAQSEFKPSDFHTRVKAAGTRDYGEDVADRNLGVNGCDLDSQPVQAFYAVRPGTSSRATTLDQRRPLSSWSRPPNFSDDEDDIMYYPHVVKQASIDSALWSKSHNSSQPAFYGNAHSQAVLSAAALQKSRALERQSYSAIGAYGTPSLAEIEALHEQQRLLNRKARGHSLQVTVHDANKLVSAWDTTSAESETSPVGTRPSTPGSTSRRLHGSSRRGGAGLPRLDLNEDGPRFAVNNQPILSPQPTSFRLSASLASSAFTTSNKRPSTMHSMQSVQRPQQSLPESHNTMPDLSNLPYHLKEKAHTFKGDWHDDLTDRESAPSPFIKTSRPRSRSRDNAHDYSRATSVITPRPRSQSGETYEHTPGRANSVRHWSMTSTAPTTSSSSSATYGRPHSRHTANTSIDLSTTTSSGSVHGDSVKKMPTPKPEAKQAHALIQLPPFNIDDYVSSDSDSFIASQAERSASEEDLLFSSGYGEMGIQLPGLEDAFSAPAPIALVRSPRLSTSKPNDDFRRTFGEPPLMSKYALQHMASDESLNSNRGQPRRSSGASEAGLQKKASREELANQAQIPARRPETKRMSALLGSSTPVGHTLNGNGALGSNSLLYHPRPNPHLTHGNNVGGQVIEEERFEKVNVATAIRLRKEAKSRKRASMMSIASQTRGRGLVKTISIEGRKNGAGATTEEKINALREKINAMTSADDASETEPVNANKRVQRSGSVHERVVASDDE